ncbi:hypothetical protein AcW1_003851 [Taiwanofungus camphoratus]|nr:hypothetical protein AcW1_003851 [Antrodia cinnamomea]
MAALSASARPPRPDDRLSCCRHRQGPNGGERGILRTGDRAEHELDRSRILGTNLTLHGHAGANERTAAAASCELGEKTTAASLPKDLSERGFHDSRDRTAPVERHD